MDNAILKKRLNTFKTDNGVLRNVGTDVVMDVLRAWEQWPGKVVDLYRELGLSKMQLVTMLQKAKRLVNSGAVTEDEFKEIKLPVAEPSSCAGLPCDAIELSWEKGHVIRFGRVEQLVDFLKKAA